MQRRRASLWLLASGFGLIVSFSALAEDEKPLPLRTREAVRKATKAIAKAEPKKGIHDTRTLMALALLRGGGPDERKVARKLLDSWWEEAVKDENILDTSGNYELSLFIMALEGTSLVHVDDPEGTQEAPRFRVRAIAKSDKERLEKATRALLAGRVKTFEGKGCAWSYLAAPLDETTRDGSSIKGLIKKGMGDEFDNSNTQFSVLALHEAARSGVAIPKDVVEAIARHFLGCAMEAKDVGRRRRDKDATPTGGEDALRWGYREKDFRESMHFAGLSSLGIARELGFTEDSVQKAIKRGLVGIGPMIARDKSEKGGMGDSYLLYSIEKALDILEVETVDGKPWFPPLAESVLKDQGASGLWDEDLIDSCFYVLFLTRGTLSKNRLIQTKGGDGSAGDVFLPKAKKTVNAVALLEAFRQTANEANKKAADEAVFALAAEGHGGDACLLRPLATLLADKGARADAAARWVREVSGQSLAKDKVEAAASAFEGLEEACDLVALRSVLAKEALPLRAYAASELAALQDKKGVADLAAACDGLASDATLLPTNAGARCARSFADALTGILVATLPDLPAKGSVPADKLKAVAQAARDRAAGK
jgi:hypothetical protein